MKVLFIGGTGRISLAVSRQAVAQGLDLYLLNRGSHNEDVPGCHWLTADIQNAEQVHSALSAQEFDVVVDWITYTPEEIERDLALFQGRVKQFIFISSASVYQKPPLQFLVSESTPRHNPYSLYSQNKIACEERLLRAYREDGLPATIVRPSHTYDRHFPFAIGGSAGYTIADRIKKKKPVIVHGDGSSLWVVTHAEDFGRGLLGLFGNEQSLGESFQITSDEVLTWNQIYQTIGEALGVEPRIVHIPSDFIVEIEPNLAGGLLGDKTWSVVFDNSKIKSFVPGFEAIIPFREGIVRTVKWFDAEEKRRQIDSATNEAIERILAAYGGTSG
ncbi:MAG TPA: SDR family oxidoreductase [Pyrinomonadaceae bacterium]